MGETTSLLPIDVAVSEVIRAAQAAEEQRIISLARDSLVRDESIEAAVTYHALARQEAEALGKLMIRNATQHSLTCQVWSDNELMCELKDARITTPLLWEADPIDVEGVSVSTGRRFVTHAGDEFYSFLDVPILWRLGPQKKRRVLSVGVEEVVRDTESSIERVIASTSVELRERENFTRIVPRPLPEVEDPNAAEYLQQIALFRVARLELGDKSIR